MSESEKDKLLKSIAEQLSFISITDLTKAENNIAKKLKDAGLLMVFNNCNENEYRVANPYPFNP